MNFVASCAWLCLVIVFTAAMPARGQSAIPDSAATGKLAISPANPRLLKNFPLQFIATFNGKTTEIPVVWTTSNPGVATIDGQGNATLLAPGTSTITASFAIFRASTVLTVTTAKNPIFSVQPRDTNVSAVIDAGTGVQVQLMDNLGGPLPGERITLSIGVDPPGTGVLSGTLSHITDATGTATFPDLRIDWLGSGYTLIAAANPISGALAGTSAAFTELRVGDPCLGPNPAVLSGCADADADGLNDAWEVAGGVDLNGDGLITDAKHDLLLPGADPSKPDIYVWYDWMDYGLQDRACSQDSQCTALGGAHRGETCIGPPVPTSATSCAYACSADTDCTDGPGNSCSSNADCSGRSFCDQTKHCSAGPWHVGERCINNMCQHTHDPLVLEPKTFQLLVDNFAAHGINLHILRGNAQPHSHVISYRKLARLDNSCEGGSLASGTAGLGKYAESLYDIKPNSTPDKLNLAYHYAFFGHYVACDTAEHCTDPSKGGAGDCPPYAAQGLTGLAEIEGNDLVVALGGAINDKAFIPHLVLPSDFMHELGHNLGLRHDGHVDRQCPSGGGCSPGDTCVDLGDGEGQVCHEITAGMTGIEQPNFKPNFISVMNYRYQGNGIMFADSVGSNSPKQCQADSDCGGPGAMCANPPRGICVRVDYSRQTLPTGGNTPGMLVESNLNEPAGLGSGTADLFNFKNGTCPLSWHIAASDGPVDWSGAGLLTSTNVQADVDAQVGTGNCDAAPSDVLSGHTEWPDIGGAFVYTFQSNKFGLNGSSTLGINGANSAGVSPPMAVTEQNAEMMIQNHTAYPLRLVNIALTPTCGLNAEESIHHRRIAVALLGASDLDVNEIDLDSLDFHGAKPVSVQVKDINNDGASDLVLEFQNADMRLSKEAKRARLTGSLKSSQDFLGEVGLAAACPATQ
jgi:hypothetical protein